MAVTNAQRTHTSAGESHGITAAGRAEQGAGQGARSAAAAGCVPAPTRPASINSWQFGARTSAAAADKSIFGSRLAFKRCLKSLGNHALWCRSCWLPTSLALALSLSRSFSLSLALARSLSRSLSIARSLSLSLLLARALSLILRRRPQCEGAGRA